MGHRILLIDPGVSRGALAAARSLHAAGHRVGIAGPRRGPASRSRSVSRFDRIPGPEEGIDRFVSAVAEIVATNGYEIVLAAGDPELLTLSSRRSTIGAVFPGPDHDALVAASDKLRIGELARAAGLSTPAVDIADTSTMASCELPVLVKARLHGDPLVGAPTRTEAAVASTREELQTLCAALVAAGHQPLIQPVTRGDLLAVTMVLAPDGARLARFQQRAERVWPRGAGISVRARSETSDEGLFRRVERLLRGLGWRGLAQVQFIAPERGEPLMIDVNGRLYGSLALAIASGVDLPSAWVASALDGDATPLEDGRPGIRYQWLEGDLRRSLQDDRRIASLLGSLRYAPGAAHSIWSAKDRAPAFHHALDLARRAVVKPFRRRRDR